MCLHVLACVCVCVCVCVCKYVCIYVWISEQGQKVDTYTLGKRE